MHDPTWLWLCEDRVLVLLQHLYSCRCGLASALCSPKSASRRLGGQATKQAAQQAIKDAAEEEAQRAKEDAEDAAAVRVSGCAL